MNPYGKEEGGDWIALENTGRGRPNDRAVVTSEVHFSSVDQVEVRASLNINNSSKPV